MTVPNSRANLDRALLRLAEGKRDTYLRLRAVVANTVIGQLLPSGAIKGGSAIKLRLGDNTTRFTTDFDLARAESLDDFVEAISMSLRHGWNGFTGRVIARNPARPAGVPARYVMQPFDVKLSYNGKPWMTTALEIGHDEIGDADEPEWDIASDIVKLFEQLGLPEPNPVPLMPLHYQAAQKIHALTEPGSRRAHDLIDLQLIDAGGLLDDKKTLNTCKRLFAYRKKQPWPSPIVADENWRMAYDAQKSGLSVLEDVDDAIAWGNELINKIVVLTESSNNLPKG